MSTPPHDRPSERYGTQQNPLKPRGIGGKIIAVLMVIGLLVGIVAIAQYFNNRTSIPVSASMVSYERQDDDTMTLWVDVTREDPSQPSYCIVTALNYAMAEVGRRELIMPAGGEEQTRMEVDIPTRDLPVSGSVYGCSVIIPPYMDVENPTYTAS